MISIKQLISKFFQAGVALIIGLVMVMSYNAGFLISGISMLVILLVIYPFLRKNLK